MSWSRWADTAERARRRMTRRPTKGTTHMAHYDPFDGNSLELPVDKHLHIDQLREEIARRTKRDDIQLAHSHEADTPEGSDGTGVLYVSPKNLDENLVRRVVDAHQPKEPEAASAHPEAKSAHPELAADEEVGQLVAALESGKDLKVAEVNKVLRALLKQSDS